MIASWEPASVHRAVVRAAARAFGTGEAEIYGREKSKPLQRARFAAYWVLRTRFPRLSHPQVAKTMGRCDHSTAIYNFRMAENLRGRDEDFRARTDALLADLPIDPPERVPGHLTATVESVLRSEAERAEEGRAVKPKNRLAIDDFDAVARRNASLAMIKAMRREHPERCGG